MSSQSVTSTIQNVSQQQSNQNVSSGAGSGQSQTFVATLATVLPPRHQTATLVYSNPQQLGTTVTGPRLAVGSPIATQRQIRPIQISNARVPTGTLNRVSAANISIRGPVLTPSSVLTSLPSGTSTTVTGSNLTVAGIPAARIIQVQQQNPGGLRTSNLMTLHPLVMSSSAVSSANAVRGVSATTAKPALTITHVGKVRIIIMIIINSIYRIEIQIVFLINRMFLRMFPKVEFNWEQQIYHKVQPLPHRCHLQRQ